MPGRLARRVAVIGWDAADWKVIHGLVDQGLMPNLQKLIERGTMGHIATLDPCISPLLWTSIATGKTADQHGITGFLEPDPISGRVRPMASTSRKGKALWNICSQSGLRSLVLNWFASHPAEPINGVMVSKEYARTRAPFGAEWTPPAGIVHPPALAKSLGELRVHPAELTGDDLLPFIPSLAKIDQRSDERPLKLASILAENISVHAAATRLMETEEWDFLAVYYDAMDHAGHHFMEFHPPRMEHVNEEEFQLYSEVMNGVYCFHDLMLGRLVELAGPDAAIMVVSDHGFHSDHLRPVESAAFAPETAMQWHRSHGVFCVSGPGIRPDELVYGATLLDIAPTVLTLLGLPAGSDMPGRVLAEALESPSLPERIASWEEAPGDAGMHPEGTRVDPWDSVEVVRNLADLGYVDAPSEDAAEEHKLVRLHQELNLARVHLSAGRPAEALPLMENLARMNPQELSFQVLLAQCYYLTDRIEDCRRVADEVLRHDSDRPMATLIKAQLSLAEGRVEEGLQSLLEAEQSTRPAPRLRLATGSVYLQLKKWTEAERTFRSVLAMDPESAAAHHGLACALLKRGDPEAAAEAGADAVGLRFDLPEAHFTLGVALAQTGRYERAIQAFETCMEQQPDADAPKQWLAHLRRQRNDRRDAVLQSQ